MNINFIKELAEIIENTTIDNIEYKSRDDSIKLSRNINKSNYEDLMYEKNNIKFDSQNIEGDLYNKTKSKIESIDIYGTNYSSYENSKEIELDKINDESIDYITSNMIGTFYSKPSPDEKVFVNIGDLVESGNTICIIESMKLMNEIKAPYKCEIIDILVKEEEVIEYGQNIFAVRKV